MTIFYNDYCTEPIGDGNPYSRCYHCHRSVPEINERLDGHLKDCLYRLTKQAGGNYDRVLRFIFLGAPEEETGTAEEDPGNWDHRDLVSLSIEDERRARDSVQFIGSILGRQ